MGSETGEITFQGVHLTDSTYFVRQWAYFENKEVTNTDNLYDRVILIGA